MEQCVSVEYLKVLGSDDHYFNKDRFKEWCNLLYNFSHDSIEILHEEIGNVEGIAFEINTVLIQEAVYDAMIGLKTIVASENNEVQSPNPFKIAAYLAYWFVRHKPIIFRAESGLDINSIQLNLRIAEEDRLEIINEIKHLNEVVATRFMLRYIFEVDSQKPLCTTKKAKSLKAQGRFCFDCFEDMFAAVYEKLKYYITYREISPKILEHFLEAYTLHPYLPYTTDLWNTEEDNV